jgi:hypothetical protein
MDHQPGERRGSSPPLQSLNYSNPPSNVLMTVKLTLVHLTLFYIILLSAGQKNKKKNKNVEEKTQCFPSHTNDMILNTHPSRVKGPSAPQIKWRPQFHRWPACPAIVVCVCPFDVLLHTAGHKLFRNIWRGYHEEEWQRLIGITSAARSSANYE